MGDLCALSESQVESLPIRSPKVKTLLSVAERIHRDKSVKIGRFSVTKIAGRDAIFLFKYF